MFLYDFNRKTSEHILFEFSWNCENITKTFESKWFFMKFSSVLEPSEKIAINLKGKRTQIQMKDKQNYHKYGISCIGMSIIYQIWDLWVPV